MAQTLRATCVTTTSVRPACVKLPDRTGPYVRYGRGLSTAGRRGRVPNEPRAESAVGALRHEHETCVTLMVCLMVMSCRECASPLISRVD